MRIKKPPLQGRGFSLTPPDGEDEVFLGDGNGQAGAVGVASFSSREETKRFTVREEMPSSAAISSYSSPSHTSRSTSISRGVSWVLLTCPRRVSGVRSG